MSYSETEKKLISMGDDIYRDFQCRLMPGIERKCVAGVRMPLIRTLAKEMKNTPDESEFLAVLPHMYYDENNLHGALISNIRNYDKAVAELERFLPYIDNWATCDMIRPKAFEKRPDELPVQLRKWLASDKIYTVRFSMEMYMSFYLDSAYKPEFTRLISEVKSNEYYINMMQAWYFATALAKQWDDVIPYIELKKLDVFTHNKTIRKAYESFRITKEQKEYLKNYIIK